MSEYSNKLRDPRWQKKRLKILERADFQCECCEDTKSPLHVHHLIYTKGEPWDAPDENLECLCEKCHEQREAFNAYFSRSLHSTLFCLSMHMFILFKLESSPVKKMTFTEFAAASEKEWHADRKARRERGEILD